MKYLNLNKNKNAKTLTYNLVDTNVIIDQNIYNFIKNKLKIVDTVRICIHSDSCELTQMMIIGITNKGGIAFHKNINKDKIYQLIVGKMNIEFNNSIIEIKPGEIFKLEKNTFAKMYSSSDYSIYYEIISGPFIQKDTIFKEFTYNE